MNQPRCVDPHPGATSTLLEIQLAYCNIESTTANTILQYVLVMVAFTLDDANIVSTHRCAGWHTALHNTGGGVVSSWVPGNATLPLSNVKSHNVALGRPTNIKSATSVRRNCGCGPPTQSFWKYDTQHSPANMKFKLHLFAYVDILAQSLKVGVSACQLQAVEKVFFAVLGASAQPFNFHVNFSPVELVLWKSPCNYPSDSCGSMQNGSSNSRSIDIFLVFFSWFSTPKWEPDVFVFGAATPKMEVWESDLQFLGVVSPSPKNCVMSNLILIFPRDPEPIFLSLEPHISGSTSQRKRYQTKQNTRTRNKTTTKPALNHHWTPRDLPHTRISPSPNHHPFHTPYTSKNPKIRSKSDCKLLKTWPASSMRNQRSSLLFSCVSKEKTGDKMANEKKGSLFFFVYILFYLTLLTGDSFGKKITLDDSTEGLLWMTQQRKPTYVICLKIKTTQKQKEEDIGVNKQVSSRGGSETPSEDRVKQKYKDITGEGTSGFLVIDLFCFWLFGMRVKLNIFNLTHNTTISHLMYCTWVEDILNGENSCKTENLISLLSLRLTHPLMIKIVEISTLSLKRFFLLFFLQIIKHHIKRKVHYYFSFVSSLSGLNSIHLSVFLFISFSKPPFNLLYLCPLLNLLHPSPGLWA
ncbi:hypothetical protein VP01_1525g2 [Puccinia sorghi]|uniref:Uncharacterized protein n=1 Tax=Puccinia sorghi TaxID=27349 RepID=A0A0L6VIM6_9BASI|nr:hypothetical protein VP01_1525g2 [Puccinia sorghi]